MLMKLVMRVAMAKLDGADYSVKAYCFSCHFWVSKPGWEKPVKKMWCSAEWTAECAFRDVSSDW
eukprot:2785710-Prorocentrum_lima.AAC.1